MLNPMAEIGRAQMTVPPFQNMVNQPGGYRHSALALTPESQTSLGVSVVGTSGALRLVCFVSYTVEINTRVLTRT